MRITCVSDLHGSYPELPGGDLLIVAGDLTAADKLYQYFEFREWLRAQQYTKKVLVAGNHDGRIESGQFFFSPLWLGADYLQDSGIEFGGFNIWGSPWTPEFFNWHFMLARGTPIKQKWDKIPRDTDILVTHGPAYGIRDTPSQNEKKCGCEDLRKALDEIKPKLHVFGHIHGGYGCETVNFSGQDCFCVNAAHMTEQYQALNKPITFDFEEVPTWVNQV